MSGLPPQDLIYSVGLIDYLSERRAAGLVRKLFELLIPGGLLIVGNMNETEAAWLCAQVGPSYVIPMHYECIAGNTGNPGHFTTLIRDSETPATVLAPARATPFTIALP